MPDIRLYDYGILRAFRYAAWGQVRVEKDKMRFCKVCCVLVVRLFVAYRDGTCRRGIFPRNMGRTALGLLRAPIQSLRVYQLADFFAMVGCAYFIYAVAVFALAQLFSIGKDEARRNYRRSFGDFGGNGFYL